MASGHEYRANRPNTWLLRPLLQSEDSSCQPGAVHTWPLLRSQATPAIAPLSGQKPTSTVPVPKAKFMVARPLYRSSLLDLTKLQLETRVVGRRGSPVEIAIQKMDTMAWVNNLNSERK